MSNDLGGGGSSRGRDPGQLFPRIEVDTLGMQGFADRVIGERDLNFTPTVESIKEVLPPGVSAFGMMVSPEKFASMSISGTTHVQSLSKLAGLLMELDMGMRALTDAARFAADKFTSTDALNAATLTDVQALFVPEPADVHTQRVNAYLGIPSEVEARPLAPQFAEEVRQSHRQQVNEALANLNEHGTAVPNPDTSPTDASGDDEGLPSPEENLLPPPVDLGELEEIREDAVWVGGLERNLEELEG